MHSAVRPCAMAGVALVGASVIAVTPIAPPPEAPAPRVHIPEVHMPQVRLTASIADIFTFPAFQQWVVNQIDDLATLGIGLAGSAAGLGQSIAAIPSTLVTATQQILSGDLLGALTTFETYLVGSLVAVGEPTLAAIIERRQRALAVSQALQAAVPAALIGVGTSIFAAVDGVLRASIIGGQGVVDALLPLNLGNLVNAVVTGTQLVVGSLVHGGQDIVDGIVFAQQTIADALAAQPAAAAVATTFSAKVSSTDVTDVPDLSGKTAMLSVNTSTDKDETAKDTSDSTKTDATEPKTTEKETPKTEDEDQPTAKDSTPSSTESDKADDPVKKSPKHEAEKKVGDSPKHESKQSDNESQSEGADQK